MNDHHHTHHPSHESEKTLPDKYSQALSKYNLHLHDEEVIDLAYKILKEHYAECDTPEVRRFLLQAMDVTSLQATDSDERIIQFTEQVNRTADTHPDWMPYAGICVYPNFVETVHNTLESEHIRIVSVAGAFPSAQTFMEVKVAEAAMALHDGADEIDMVMPIGKFLHNDYEGMCDEIEEIKSVCGESTLKVILETGLLPSVSDIKNAALLCMYAGADFIKTSTGKARISATPEVVLTMADAILDYYHVTGRRVGIKIAGGLKRVEDAVKYYAIVKEVLGDDWLTPELFRIGASSLSEILIKEMENGL